LFFIYLQKRIEGLNMGFSSQFEHVSYREYEKHDNSYLSQFINAYKRLKLIRSESNIFIGKNVQFQDISGIHLSKGVTIGNNSIILCDKGSKIIIRENSTLHGWHYIQACLDCTIDIGAGVALNLGTKIIGGNISIGDDCMIAHDVSIVGIDHIIKKDRPATYGEAISGDISIGDSVWIGCRSVILKNIKIGHHAVIGAGSVVTKDVEPATVVAGNPARIIGHLE
jgi:acetyltransferase-like isoleucine patch superfamily enzyme